MPTAGFYAIESHRISFGKDGEWYSDGERIENRKIADLFSRCVRKNPAGGFITGLASRKTQTDTCAIRFSQYCSRFPANGSTDRHSASV